MALERKAVTVHYRKFTTPVGSAETLQQMVIGAMNSAHGGYRVRDRYTSRVWSSGDDNYFVNTYVEGTPGGEPLAFGDVIHFTKGHLQALLDGTAANVPSLPVRQMPAPAQNEYVHSQLFWLIKDNHVFVIQSMSLRTTELEQYLAWLLAHRSPAAFTNPIVLSAQFDADAVGGDLNDIQEIIVGGVAASPPAQVQPVPAPIEEAVTTREVTTHGEVETSRRTDWAQAKEILQTLLGGDAQVAENVLRSVPAEAELRVEVHIGYKTRKRQIDRSSLRQLETGLRNLADSELTVRGKDGVKTPAGSIRLQHKASVLLTKMQDGDVQVIGSLLDPSDVLRAMFEAYTTMNANGKLS